MSRKKCVRGNTRKESKSLLGKGGIGAKNFPFQTAGSRAGSENEDENENENDKERESRPLSAGRLQGLADGAGLAPIDPQGFIP
jgi:hypothetical protein